VGLFSSFVALSGRFVADIESQKIAEVLVAGPCTPGALSDMVNSLNVKFLVGETVHTGKNTNAARNIPASMPQGTYHLCANECPS
jgi:hypothetical protein